MAIHRTSIMLSVVLVVSAFVVQEARADFQALGLVATKSPASMQCQEGQCTAYLSAFCLEKNRPPPPSRTVYSPTERTKVTLIVETAAGRTLRLAGNDWLRYETQTNYTGVLVVADAARIAKLDAVKMSVEVAAMATLLPVAKNGGDNQHSAEEIALVTGPYRQAAQHYFEKNAAGTKAVSFAADLINSLPRSGNISEKRQNKIVTTALAKLQKSKTSQETRTEVGRLLGVCHVGFPRKQHMSMRLCVEYEHGALQVLTNTRFWESQGGV